MKKQILLLALSATFATANAQNGPGNTVGDTGTVSFTYMGNSVTYTTVRAADGMVWLQQNLGSPVIATSATDVAAFGHYFQWGRWDDGHQVGTSTTVAATTISPNNPLGLGSGNINFLTGNYPADWWPAGSNNDSWTINPPSSTNGKDPCTLIGIGWHLPTQTEFANIATQEGINDTGTAFSSNLKLTASGSREPIFGGFINSSLYGQYWAATPSSQYAKNVTILDNAINTSDDGLRSYGMNVRCLSPCAAVTPPGSMTGDDTVCQGSTLIYYINAVVDADAYTWTVPAGWTIVGANNDTTVTVIAGSNSGTVTVTASNECNFENSTMLVTVHPLPVPVITASANTLSTGTFTTYQWLVNDTIINGATTNPYTVTASGPYKVIVTDANGCSDTSVVFTHTLGVGNIPGAEKITLYPNPATDMLNITAPIKVNVTIYSIDGRLAIASENATQVDISTLPAGTYHVKITDKDGRTVKMEKLTVLRQ